MWSIREVAELAGVTPRAVRHYNAIGLLAPPARRDDGHKRYGREHLDRLVRIKRLRDLGLGLERIAALDDAADAVRALDADVTGTIDRLQHARTDIGFLLRERVPTELPPEFVPSDVVRQLSAPDRSFVVVMSRVLGPQARRAYADVLRNPPADPATADFENLPADADAPDCRDLATRMALHVRDLRSRFPALRDLHAGSPHGRRFSAEVAADAKRELYNPAQVDVMDRTSALLDR